MSPQEYYDPQLDTNYLQKDGQLLPLSRPSTSPRKLPDASEQLPLELSDYAKYKRSTSLKPELFCPLHPESKLRLYNNRLPNSEDVADQTSEHTYHSNRGSPYLGSPAKQDLTPADQVYLNKLQTSQSSPDKKQDTKKKGKTRYSFSSGKRREHSLGQSIQHLNQDSPHLRYPDIPELTRTSESWIDTTNEQQPSQSSSNKPTFKKK